MNSIFHTDEQHKNEKETTTELGICRAYVVALFKRRASLPFNSFKLNQLQEK